MATYLGEAVLGLALLFALFWLWEQLTHSTLGRAVQGLLITAIYFAWIGLPIFGFYNVFSEAGKGWSDRNFGGSIFILAYGTPCMLIMLALPLAMLNFYLKALNHKWGLNLKYVSFLHDPGRW